MALPFQLTETINEPRIKEYEASLKNDRKIGIGGLSFLISVFTIQLIYILITEFVH